MPRVKNIEACQSSAGNEDDGSVRGRAGSDGRGLLAVIDEIDRLTARANDEDTGMNGASKTITKKTPPPPGGRCGKAVKISVVRSNGDNDDGSAAFGEEIIGGSEKNDSENVKMKIMATGSSGKSSAIDLGRRTQKERSAAVVVGSARKGGIGRGRHGNGYEIGNVETNDSGKGPKTKDASSVEGTLNTLKSNRRRRKGRKSSSGRKERKTSRMEDYSEEKGRKSAKKDRARRHGYPTEVTVITTDSGARGDKGHKKSDRGGVGASTSSAKKEPSERADGNIAAVISKRDGRSDKGDDFKADNGGRDAASNNASVNADASDLAAKKLDAVAVLVGGEAKRHSISNAGKDGPGRCSPAEVPVEKSADTETIGKDEVGTKRSAPALSLSATKLQPVAKKQRNRSNKVVFDVVHASETAFAAQRRNNNCQESIPTFGSTYASSASKSGTNQASPLGKNCGWDKTGGIISNAIASRSIPSSTSECTTNHPPSLIDKGRFQTKGGDPLVDIDHWFENMTAASKQMEEMVAVARETFKDYETRLLHMRQQQEARQLQQQCLAGEKMQSQLEERKPEDERLEGELRELLQNQKLENEHLKKELRRQRETNVAMDAMMNEAKADVGELRAQLEKEREVNREKDVFAEKLKETLRSLL